MLPTDPRNRHALLIGINCYPSLRPEQQLLGAINDAEQMRHVLIDRFDFPLAGITLLRDAEATRAGMLAAFESLVERVGEDDVVVVHFSGHGSQIRSSSSHEPDGLDETLMPFDGHRDPARELCDITDDEVYARLARLAEKTPFVTLVLDCCHSGHAYRNGVGSRHVPPDLRRARQPFSTATAGGRRSILHERCVVLAACRDDEEAFERRRGGGEVSHGFWTFALLRALQEARPGATARDVFETACALVLTECPRQRPQIEGARDRAIFGVEMRPPARSVVVGISRDGRPTLAAGAAQGLTEGSVWVVYPQGTKEPGEVPELARVRVVKVGALSSIAEVLAPAGAVFEAGARAFEHEPAYGDRRLAVALDGGERSPELAARIAASPLLRPVAASEAPEVMVAKGFKLEDAQGYSISRPADVRAEPTIDETLARLERRARCRHGVLLENRDPKSRLAGKVDFRLLRRRGAGEWRPAAGSAEAVWDFCEGDQLLIEIEHRHDTALWVYVLDFGLTDKVTLLYPGPGAHELLEPEILLRLGEREREEMELCFPGDFDFGGNGVPERSRGFGFIRLFMTTHATDFEYLRTDAPWPEAHRIGRGSLAKLLAMGQLVEAMRIEGEDWLAVTRAYELGRSG